MRLVEQERVAELREEASCLSIMPSLSRTIILTASTTNKTTTPTSTAPTPCSYGRLWLVSVAIITEPGSVERHGSFSIQPLSEALSGCVRSGDARDPRWRLQLASFAILAGRSPRVAAAQFPAL